MRFIRYQDGSKARLAVLSDEEHVYMTSFSDLIELMEHVRKEQISLVSYAEQLMSSTMPLNVEWSEMKLLIPVEAPEIWAAGVTYERSKVARNTEMSASPVGRETYYDKVYHAERPEIFFKSTWYRSAHPNEDVCIRSDSEWQIPEPELGLVLDKDAKIIGFTIGNDMSCRDIEGENPLYLPQAKMWRRSCAIGPTVRLAETVGNPYNLDIYCRIYRNGMKLVDGSANTSQLKRTYDELIEYLARDNEIYDGTVLLTGTCIIPPDDFSLKVGDLIEIEIPSVGVLRNGVQLATYYGV